MTMWKKVMLHLGLAPDEDYDDFEPTASDRMSAESVDTVGGGDIVRTSMLGGPEPDAGSSFEVAPMTTPSVQSRPRSTVVRPLPSPSRTKPHIVNPRSFNDAQEVADKYRAKQAVIVNLQEADPDLSRRLIDFSSGLCYGLGGQMEKVARQVYLLTPDEVEVSVEDRRQLREDGLLS